jgi:hypothetical protein
LRTVSRTPPVTRSCGFDASETIPFPGADSIFSRCLAPFPGDSVLPSASGAATPATEAPWFKNRRSAPGLLRRVNRVESARLARRATRARRLPPWRRAFRRPWNGLAQNRDSFPIL